MNLADGTLIGGRYRIVKFLGQGGFGCTYMVQHTHLNKRYAVKEFFVADICNRDDSGRVSVGTHSKVDVFDRLLKKFVKEANALVDLSGIKGIVNVVDVFEENGTAYFVMDYIEGMSVERMLQLDGPMSEQRAVQIIRETALALAEVHKRNYLHLDIKPDNIMLDFDYHPTLIDFGVSKQYDANDGHNSSTLMGHTPGFAPMEQSLSKVGQFYPATDIYALGATLYCMLTGQNPDTPSDRLNFPRPIADDLPAGTSPNVVAAIEAAMQLRVNDRPQSIADFLAILDGKSSSSKKTEPENKPAKEPLSFKNNVVTELKPEVQSLKCKEYEFIMRKEAPNLSLVIQYKGNIYYVTESEWTKVPESTKQQVEKLGLVVKGNGMSLMIEPRDLISERITWGDAMKRYVKYMPNKDQGKVIANQCVPINKSLITFGLSPMSDSYWTCTDYGTYFAWYIYMLNGGVGNYGKTYLCRIRAVAPVPVASSK